MGFHKKETGLSYGQAFIIFTLVHKDSGLKLPTRPPVTHNAPVYRCRTIDADPMDSTTRIVGIADEVHTLFQYRNLADTIGHLPKIGDGNFVDPESGYDVMNHVAAGRISVDATQLKWSGFCKALTTKPSDIHPEEKRVLSVREYALIQGFDHHFFLSAGLLNQQYKAIGNAVPVSLSLALATTFLEAQGVI